MSPAPVRPRAALLAAVALPLAAFALVVPQIVAQDLPWWDEPTYLALGRGLLAGAPPDFAWSPAYALTLGIARAALGPVRAIPVVHVAWAAVFAVAVGLSARALLRDARPALALGAIALGSSHALVVIGPQRAAISLVLLAFAAMASRRWPRVGLAAGAMLALAAAACRLEAAFAIPFLLPAAWAASPGAAPRRTARIGWAAAFTAAALAMTLGTSTADKRAWFAFGQHYAFAAAERDPGSLRPGFVPALDYDELMRRDFPGATSVGSAARVAPVRFGLHVGRNAATAVEVAAAALMPERFRGWKGAALVAALALAVASAWVRRREPLPRGVVWLSIGLAATSSGALLVVPQGRHVLGLSLAMLFLLAAAAWATAPRAAPFLTVAGVLTLVSAHTLARADPGPRTVRRLVAHARARPGPTVVAGAGSFCFCAYLDACEAHDDPSAGGKGEHERDCAAVALAPSYFTSSMAPSRPPCVTSAYERIAVNPEVWERRSGVSRDRAGDASVDAGSVVADVRPPTSANPACVKPDGAPVVFSVRNLGFSAAALDAGSLSPVQRVETVYHEGIGGSVRWVVETANEIVVGFQAPAYCGGAAPPAEMFPVVLPVSKKPVRVQKCIEGTCSGPPRP